MTPVDLHEELERLASRLADPPPSSVAAVEHRARRRRRRQLVVGVAAAVAAVVLGVAVATSLWVDRDVDPIHPEVGDAFGPVLAEAHVCPAELPDCPDRSHREALEEAIDHLEAHPATEVVEVRTGERPSPTDQGSGPPADLGVVFRIDRTTAADALLGELVGLPVVHSVSLGTADRTPSELREAGTSTGPGRAHARLDVPVHGRPAPAMLELWEPAPGTVCYDIEQAVTVCTHVSVGTGGLGGSSATGGRPLSCLTLSTGLGVDHVRMRLPDGSRLRVVTTPLHPNLGLVDLHVACWADGPGGAIAEIIGADGTIIERAPG